MTYYVEVECNIHSQRDEPCLLPTLSLLAGSIRSVKPVRFKMNPTEQPTLGRVRLGRVTHTVHAVLNLNLGNIVCNDLFNITVLHLLICRYK